MAQSILDKINTLISANLHSMVDSALQANSVKVMDEYVRQAEKNLENLEDATVTVGGTVKTLKRKYEEISAAAEKLDRDIDTLLTRGKTDLAAAAQDVFIERRHLHGGCLRQMKKRRKPRLPPLCQKRGNGVRQEH